MGGRDVRAGVPLLRAHEERLRGSAIALVAWSWSVALLLVTLAVAGGTLHDLDRWALDASGSLAWRPLDVLGSLVGLFGLAEVTAAIALAMAIARLRRYPRDALVPLAIAAVVVVEAVLKTLVPQAPPPSELARSVPLLPSVHVAFAGSFPSGHVARTAFLLRIAHGLPAWVVVGALALMVASRVYLGEHWLSDTIGGLVLGLGVANVARRLA